MLVTLVLAIAATGLDFEASVVAMQRAVIRGDVSALEDFRDRYRTALDDAPAEDTDRLRYALAYVSWRLSASEKRGSKPYKALLEDAEEQLKLLLAADPADAEAQALYGSVNGALITGLWSGIRRGPRSSKAYEAAREAAPDNPRVAMHEGVSRLFSPKMAGGSVDKAEKRLTRALRLFEGEPIDTPWPNYGRAEVLAWLGYTMRRKEDYARAREYYKRALVLEPDYRWVRDVLLPGLESDEAKAKQ
jgi:tetratricopeptide (TPR) repeat protein